MVSKIPPSRYRTTPAVFGSGDRPLSYRPTTAKHPQSHSSDRPSPPCSSHAIANPSQPKARGLKQSQSLSLGYCGKEQAEALAVVMRGKADRLSPCRAPVCLAFAIFGNAIALL